MAKVDIISVGYRSEQFLPRLTCDLKTCTNNKHEFYYSDNTGNPKTLPKLWNELAALGHSEYLAILNPDIALSPEWDERLIQCLQSNPDVGLATADPAPFALACPSPEEMAALSSSRKNRADLGSDPVQFFVAFMKRVDWERLGGVDERMRFYMQDIDFIVRLREQSKKRTVRVFSCPVWHYGSASTKEAGKRNEIDAQRECDFGSWVFTEVRQGRMKEWHLLSDLERRTVREDERFSKIPIR